MYSGAADLKTGFKALDAQVCNWQGVPHFCYTQFQGPISGGPGGVGSWTKIQDQSYTTVQTVEPSGAWDSHNLTHDLHEFNMQGATGSSALIVSYVTYPHSVTYPKCNGSPSTTFTKTGIFSEVSTDGSNTELFRWVAIERVDPHDSYVCPGDANAGTGQVQASGFDFL